MKAYSSNLRQKILAVARHRDRSIREVAVLSGVCLSFINKLLSLYCSDADLAPRSHGDGYPNRALPQHEKLLRAEPRRRTASTLEELRARLEEHDDLSVSISTVSQTLIRLDLLGKKSMTASERNNCRLD